MDIKKLSQRLSSFFQRIFNLGVLLRPGELIDLKGLGVSFEGIYYVVSVNHGISEEGYKVTNIRIRPKDDAHLVNDDNDGEI